jgi:hypothetical protein
MRMNYRTWTGRAGVTLGLLLALAAPATAALAAGPNDAAAQKAARWVVAQQKPDGSFPGFGVGSTADALIGLAATGQTAKTEAALSYLEGQAAGYAKTPGAAAKVLLALAAAGSARDPHAFGGVDLMQIIGAGYDSGGARPGHYGQDVTGQALVLLALKARGETIPPAAVSWLIGAQGPEGGWAFDGSTAAGAADTNTTGLALQALAAVGAASDPAVAKAVAYLRAQQNADGGFAYQKAPDAASDSNSTAMAIMGLLAAGEDPAGATWTQGGKGPVAFLLQMQNASGALRYQQTQPEDNAGATYQALPALVELTLPITPVAQPILAPAPGGAVGMPRTGQGPDGALPLLAVLGAALALGGRRLARR